MQDVYKKESGRNSPHSNSHSGANSQSWWNSTGSQVPQNSLSKSVSLTMDSSRQDCPSVKQFGFQLQDQDSSSSQSTGQSHNEISNMGANNRNGQCISVHSGICCSLLIWNQEFSDNFLTCYVLLLKFCSCT